MALTKTAVVASASTAFNLEQRIKQTALVAHASWWALSELLYEFHEGGYWADLGHDSLDAFLAQPDIGISRSQFFKQSKTWRDLVIVKEIAPEKLKDLEPSKVREVVPAIMRGEVEPEKALTDAEELSFRDVVIRYRPEEQGKHGARDAPLDASQEPQRIQCKVCGSWYTPKPDIDSTAEEVT